jgi:hypothetical protein
MAIIMRLLPLLLISIVTVTSAHAGKIYSWKDANGHTVFGDNPVHADKAKEIIQEPMNIIPGYRDPDVVAKENAMKAAADAANNNSENTDEEAYTYTSFKIASPQSGETFRDNSGNTKIEFNLTPRLQEGDTITVYVDGKKKIEGSQSLNITLTGLDRGDHSVFAVVRNPEGDVLLNSDTVTFTLLRYSAFNRKAAEENKTTTGNSEGWMDTYQKQIKTVQPPKDSWSATYQKQIKIFTPPKTTTP